jgi:cytochrome c
MGRTIASIVLVLFGMVCPLRAEQAEDARALVERAVAMFKANGREAAMKTINRKDSPFIKGDLYVFAFSMDNLMLAHPYEHSLPGASPATTVDTNGVPFFQKFMAVVERDDTGWVDYMWANPGEKEPSPKRAFVKKVPLDDAYVACGYSVHVGPHSKSVSKN